MAQLSWLHSGAIMGGPPAPICLVLISPTSVTTYSTQLSWWVILSFGFMFLLFLKFAGVPRKSPWPFSNHTFKDLHFQAASLLVLSFLCQMYKVFGIYLCGLHWVQTHFLIQGMLSFKLSKKSALFEFEEGLEE